MVWFGDEDDGCADLAVTLVQAGNGAPFDPGETMHAISTIRNQGSGLAVTSKVAYYLSRDDVKDDGDIRLGDHTVGHLDAGAAIGDAKDIVMPSLFLGAAGDYRLLACADDTKLVDEISNTNNCRASTLTFTVNPGKPTAHPVQPGARLADRRAGNAGHRRQPTPSAKPGDAHGAGHDRRGRSRRDAGHAFGRLRPFTGAWARRRRSGSTRHGRHSGANVRRRKAEGRDGRKLVLPAGSRRAVVPPRLRAPRAATTAALRTTAAARRSRSTRARRLSGRSARPGRVTPAAGSSFRRPSRSRQPR